MGVVGVESVRQTRMGARSEEEKSRTNQPFIDFSPNCRGDQRRWLSFHGVYVGALINFEL